MSSCSAFFLYQDMLTFVKFLYLVRGVYTNFVIVRSVHSNQRLIYKETESQLTQLWWLDGKSRRLVLCQLARTLTNPFAFIDGLQGCLTYAFVSCCHLLID